MEKTSEDDEKLLESGKFSDAAVKCGKRSWPVHKAILCSRSEWFRAALRGSRQFIQDGRDFLPRDELVGLFDGVRSAYEHDVKVLKYAFINFVACTHLWVLEESNFKELRSAVPAFGLAILDELPKAVASKRYFPRCRPEVCSDCTRAIEDDPNLYRVSLCGKLGVTLFPTCNHCDGERVL